MIDPFVLLTPALVLAIFALVRFVGCLSKPAPPGPHIEAAPGDSKVFLAWELWESYNDDYIIKRATVPGGPYAVVGNVPGSVATFTDRGLTNGTTYYYVVTQDTEDGTRDSNEASAVPAPIVFRQLAEFQDQSGSDTDTVAATPFGNLGAGSLVVVWIWYNSLTQTVESVWDTAGNQYLPAAAPKAGTAPFGWQQELWSARNTAGGANVVVSALFTGSFTQEKAIGAHEYTGAGPGDPFEEPLDVSGADASAGPTVSSGTVMASGAGLVFGAAIFANVGSAGPGFTGRSVLGGNATEEMRLAAAGPAEATFTNPTPGQEWIAQVAVFR